MSTGTQRSRRSIGASLLVGAVLVSFLVPIAVQAAPAGTYSASSSATLLNLQLFAVPGAPGLTLGQTSSELKSSPLSAKATGTALNCPGTTECATKTTQSATAPPDSDPAATTVSPDLPAPLNNILALTGVFGDAAAGTASGDPTGVGTAGVTKLNAVLSVASLQPGGDQLQQVVNQIGDQLASLIGLVPNSGQNEVDQKIGEIKTALKSILGAITGKREVIAIEVGASTAKSLSEGMSVSGLANTAGLRIGLLPVCPLEPSTAEANAPLQEAKSCVEALVGTQSTQANPHYLDPFKYGLLVIDVTVGLAEAKWDGATGKGTNGGTAASVKIKARDLSVAGDPVTTPLAYREVKLDLQGVEIPLPSLLETTIKPGSVVPDNATNSVTVNALEIHALKSLTDPSASSIKQQSNSQGGILLQVGNLKASATGAGPTSVLGLPKTGGMRYVFYTVAALLIVGAPVAYIVSRRLRRTTT